MNSIKNSDTNVLYGRFQPFTTADLESIRRLKDNTGKKTVLVYIRSHQWYANTPFRSATVREMLRRVMNAYPDLVDRVASVDRWEDAVKTVSYTAHESIESDHNSPKSCLSRLALAASEEDVFKMTVPECIHGMYSRLRSEVRSGGAV